MPTPTRARSVRDPAAFAALGAFLAVMYAVPGEWIPLLAPLRLALVFSALAGALLLAAPTQLRLDGVRGASLVALCALALASVHWAVHAETTSATAAELLKLGAGYLMLVNLASSWERLRRLSALLVLVSAVTSVGVIGWYLRGTGLVEGYRARWVGVYADPNHLAMALVLVVPLGVAMAARRALGLPLRLAAALAAALATLAIVYTHSRGGFLGLAVAMAIWSLREPKRLRTFAVGAALGAVLLALAPGSFWRRGETVTRLSEDVSAQGRVYAWEVTERINRERPIAGVGAGGFRYAWAQYAPAEAHRAYVAHNVFLDVLGELGLLGFALFLAVVGGAAAGVWRAGRDEAHGWLARALGASLFGYLVCQLTSGYLLSSHLFVLLGLCAACGNRVQASPVPSAAETSAAP